MQLLGWTISRAPKEEKMAALVPDGNFGRGWISLIAEPFTGAWQRNITASRDSVLTFHAVFSCLTLISSDIAKLRVKLMERGDVKAVWEETTNPSYSPVLRKPNRYQTRIQFWESWILSKLMRGNTYVLKERDMRGVVRRLYVLDPTRVTPMVADDGSVFYRLSADNLAGVESDVIVPAREIIHDRINCLFHHLVGISPLIAAALSSTQGLNIQSQSAWFFGNRGMPGSILTAPGHIPQDVVDRLKATWDDNYSGKNAGKVAVLGDGLQYQQLPLSSREAQVVEQMKWTAEVVCSVFHVPPYKIGVGTMPSYNNVQALNVEYYSQCLQIHIESAEVLLDEGLEMDTDIGTEFDLEGLLRMDAQTQATVEKELVGAGIKAPNESRWRFDLIPKLGGESPYLQQQNYSLAALAKRDAQENPFASAAPPAPPPPAPPEDGGDDEEPAPDDSDDDGAGDVGDSKQYADRILAHARAYATG